MPEDQRKAVRSHASQTRTENSPLVTLPVELLRQVLGMLNPKDLLKLLQTCKAMLQEVLQHRSGRLTRKVKTSHKVGVIKKLLQWAPPACLKLVLEGAQQPCPHPYHDWGLLQGLFDSPVTACHAAGNQHFQCVLEVSITKFMLPTLVPSELVATCPNLRQVHLHECELHGKQQMSSSKGGSSSRASTQPSENSRGMWNEGSTCQARNLHTLSLGVVHAATLQNMDPYACAVGCSCTGQQQNLPSGNAKLTRKSAAAAEHYAEQVRASVPNVKCLKLCTDNPCIDFIWPVLGPQLTEVTMPVEGQPFSKNCRLMPKHLRQLQKLVMPHVHTLSAATMKWLLKLPQLTHVELGNVRDLPQDYSNHPCQWQYLHLHLGKGAVLQLNDLAKLPIHSLTQPLALGTEGIDGIEVMLPSQAESPSPAVLQRLATQLSRCRVKLWPCALVWGRHSSMQGQGADMVAAFKLIASAFGPHADVWLKCMAVDQALLQEVAAVYQGSLKKPTFKGCHHSADMQPAWHAALSGLPALEAVEHASDGVETANSIKSLARATAQHGRAIEVTLANYFHQTAEAVLKIFQKEVVQHEELEGVQLAVKPRASKWIPVSVCITSSNPP